MGDRDTRPITPARALSAAHVEVSFARVWERDASEELDTLDGGANSDVCAAYAREHWAEAATWTLVYLLGGSR